MKFLTHTSRLFAVLCCLFTITLVAKAGIEGYNLSYSAGTGGTISGSNFQFVLPGDDGSTVTAVPDAGYTFSGWDDNYLSASRTDQNVEFDITVVANFAINTYTLTYNAGMGGSISGDPSQIVTNGNNGTSVTAVPDTGFHFTSWDDFSTQNPRTDSGVTANISVTANFEINTYTLDYSAGPGGSISGFGFMLVSHFFQNVDYLNDGEPVTAEADEGHHFVDWSDASTDNPRTDSGVTADLTVTANFAINTYTLTYIAGTNGSITGTTPQTVDHGTAGSAVTAVPDAGYTFTTWSDASTQNPRIDSETGVTSNITVTAMFNAIPVAGADNLDRPAIGRVVKVLKSVLLANDTDADLETLTITNVSNALPSGATVALVGNFVVYTAPDLLAGDGSFEYTLSDGIHSVTGAVTVLEKTSVADSPPNIVSIAVVGSDVELKFIGVPGRNYVVQYTTDTGEPYTWQDVIGPTPITAPDSGVMTYTDENPTGPARFYRAVLLPVIGS